MWTGRRDACASASVALARDKLVDPPSMRGAASSLLTSPLPQCGGLIFFHLPKAAGSTIECFLGAQPQFACCYRGTCGYCKQWGRGRVDAADGQCENRGLLPEWQYGSLWGKEDGTFVLPFDLFRAKDINSSRSVLRSLRFVSSQHLGPSSITPGMTTTRNPQVIKWTYMRDLIFPPIGCSLTIATFLRHPVAALISAYAYTRPKESLAAWARSHASVLLGVRPGTFIEARGAEGGKRSRHGAAFDAHVDAMAAKFPEATLDPLLSLFDVVGLVERFDESLLMLIDSAGLQAPLACATPRNMQAQGCAKSKRALDRPGTAPPDQCYNSSSGSAQWIEVAATMPALVAWYERRISLFDQDVARRGFAFRRRVRQLADLRKQAARERS